MNETQVVPAAKFGPAIDYLTEADEIWRVVTCWPNFAKDTLGKQLVRAIDGVAPNIAEGSGRHSYQDNRWFVRIARGSLNETQHWLRELSSVTFCRRHKWQR